MAEYMEAQGSQEDAEHRMHSISNGIKNRENDMFWNDVGCDVQWWLKLLVEEEIKTAMLVKSELLLLKPDVLAIKSVNATHHIAERIAAEVLWSYDESVADARISIWK